MNIYSFTAMVPANVDIEADSEEEAREIMAEGVDWDVNMDNVDEFAELEDVEESDNEEDYDDEEDDEEEEADDSDEDQLQSIDEHQDGYWKVASLEDEVRLKKRIDKDLLNEKVKQVNADLGWDCVQVEGDTLSIYGDNPETDK